MATGWGPYFDAMFPPARVTAWIDFKRMSTGVNIARRLWDRREELRQEYCDICWRLRSDDLPARHPGAFHYFEGSRWVVDRREDLPTSRDVEVYIRGTQDPDGMVEREIVVHQLHADSPITPRQARQVARRLIAAADEVGELTD